MKLAHFGTFDVENYGDLLFPLILEHRLSSVCDEFVHVSPVGGPPPWDDCVESLGFSQFLQDSSDIDGVVVGGGQIIRATPTPLGVYDAGGISSFLTYPSLWLGTSYVAARDNLPLCWNAAGVPRDFAPVAAQLVGWATSMVDYLAVRDEPSRLWLQDAGVTNAINIVPDTAIEVSKLWTREEIGEAYEDSFSRRNRSVPSRTVACHVNSRWAGEDLAAIAARIDRICRRLEATAVLVAIGPCHGDIRVQREVAGEMNTEPLLIDRPRSLREIAACIAHSDAYLGSSLHGMITACSFGTRGMMIASKEDAKYPGFLQHFGLTSWLAGSWHEAEKRVDELLASPPDTWESINGTAAPLLDRHWSLVRATLRDREEEATAGSARVRDKRTDLARLHNIGQDRYGDTEPFHAIISESLEINQAQFRTTRRRLAQVSQNLKQEGHKLEVAREKLKEERRERRAANAEVATLTAWLEELDREISALSGSRGWKISHALAKLRRIVLRGPKDPSRMDRLEMVLKRYRAWRRGRPSRAG